MEKFPGIGGPALPPGRTKATPTIFAYHILIAPGSSWHRRLTWTVGAGFKPAPTLFFLLFMAGPKTQE